ncbi:MAG TPA: phosphoribosylglycinamide formyltransferase [Candidatus Limnocylindria bacterium]
MRLGVLVSGRGSNLGAVLAAVADGRLPRVEPVVVACNRPDVPALAIARLHGVPSHVLPRGAFADAHARDAALGRLLTDAGADLALLAGYDQLLHRSYFDAFAGRTINVHPSLLPRHGGRGMRGMAVHAAVLASGDRETGVTIHEVTPELDAGPPIAVARMAVRSGETAEQLAKRVLVEEHRLLLRVLADLSAEVVAPVPSGSMTAAPPVTTRAGDPQQRSPFDA